MFQVDANPWPLRATAGASHSEVLRHLLKVYPGRLVAAGEPLCRQEEDAETVYFLLEGQVILTSMTESGHEVEIATLHSGDLIGIEAFCGPRYLTTAHTVGSCRVAAVPRARFIELMRDHPHLACAVLSRIVGELCALRERLSDLCGRSAVQRLAQHLLRSVRPDESTITLPWGSRARISRKLAMKQETLSRALRELADRGLVDVHRSELVLKDREGLRRLCA